MTMKKLGSLAAMVLLAASLTACGGGGADSSTTVTTTTVGQQLTDLKKALDAGAITQSEYETQRRKILNQ
jgi:ABC-type glycerol-3-phosphate transport system substrate-binding protein